MDSEKFQELVLQQLQALAEGQKQLFEGQKQLFERQEQLAEGQKQLFKGQEQLFEGQKQLFKGQEQLFEGQKQLENRLDSLEKRMTKLELRLENEVIPKISALFDGYQLRGDQVENLKQYLDEKLDGIALDVNYLIGRIVRHDTAIRELKQAK
ncbi:MAG: hypothetical protein K6U04_07880 [Armatimonadetes bacterium]|nr:hypothetical protein [Armatimonadota bacterium]